MEDKVKILDLDFVFISYKEPNCEENYADLLNKVPWAKRVHGVEGFDSAHKAAAKIAETDFFISVDGDNIINESFLLQTLDWSKTNPKHVHRWRAQNNINGLIYGNGGLVGWHKETCAVMKTHENATADDNKGQVDFCWSVPHANLHNCYSTTVINTTPQQAFVAGYREGVKMSLNQGKLVDPANFKQIIHPSNIKKLVTWMSIGADIENGNYAMLGTRVGLYLTTLQNQDVLNIRNLDNLSELFVDYTDNVDKDLLAHGESIRQRLGLHVAEYNSQQSSFFKFCQPNHINRGVQDLED